DACAWRPPRFSSAPIPETRGSALGGTGKGSQRLNTEVVKVSSEGSPWPPVERWVRRGNQYQRGTASLPMVERLSMPVIAARHERLISDRGIAADGRAPPPPRARPAPVAGPRPCWDRGSGSKRSTMPD